RRSPERPFERRAAALQPGHLLGEARRAGRDTPGGEQRVPHPRQGGGQHVAHDRAEEVREDELHHPPPRPPARRGRAGVPVHHDHLVPPPGQRHAPEHPHPPSTPDAALLTPPVPVPTWGLPPPKQYLHNIKTHSTARP